MFGQISKVLLTATLLTFLAACGSGGSGSGDPVISEANNPPNTGGSEPGSGGGGAGKAGFSLLDRSPGADAINRSLLTTVELNFDRVLMAATVNPAAIYAEQAGARQNTTLIHTGGTARVQLGFTQPLLPNTRYTVVISGALMAEDGSSYTEQRWDFETTGEIGSTSQAVIDQCMSREDIDMLAAVNQARSQARSCGSTASPAVAALAWNCKLEQAAHGHSQDMVDNNFFSHTGSDGLSLGARVTNTGYSWNGVAENIAAGQQSIAQVMTGWLNSPGHCTNIMADWVLEMGASRVSTTSAAYSDYWTQNFASPR